MKLSLAWIFDHIKGSWKEHDVNELVAKFNAVTAEIEQVKKISYDWSAFSLAQVASIDQGVVIVNSSEWKLESKLPMRPDAVVGQWYLIKKNKRICSWATLEDMHAAKEGLFPAVFCPEHDIKGGWKKTIESEDYIFTLDNKSVTHRPDLWGHRGFAREIAAMLDMQLIPEERFLVAKPIRHYDKIVPQAAHAIALEIVPGSGCNRLAGLYIKNIVNRPSFITMAIRLARIDARPITSLVDCTNYVMYDMGQPMHAFDASKIENKKIIACSAQAGQALTLLDGQTISLRPEDCIISNGVSPLALAGIMGGKESAVTRLTQEILIESAHFDAARIRQAAVHFKRRTEASARFEKNLDPHQNTQALMRFLKLLDDIGCEYVGADAIISVGPLVNEVIIAITHDFIVKRIGVSLAVDLVVKLLSRIGFGVQVKQDQHTVVYTIIVPSFRGTKDIVRKEDIVEEVARCYGFAAIAEVAPQRSMKPFDTHAIFKIRDIKHHCAYALGMHEVSNYALYDEYFLKRLLWQPAHALALKNPVSEHYTRMVTSLIPHLLKNVYDASRDVQEVSFFEWNNVWMFSDAPVEQKKLAGVWFSHKEPFNFYTIKARLQTFFNYLGMMVVWQKPHTLPGPWFNPLQTAELVCDGVAIGYAGCVAPLFLKNISDGHAYIFELDGDFLMNYRPQKQAFQALSKYPSVHLDISMLIDSSVTVSDIEMCIAHVDSRIKDIILLDFFEKKEWGTQRSVTFRYVVQDDHKTMTKEEIDIIMHDVASAVKALGAQIR
ncbi:MAG: phenylalanine--tRNA ligase subunit beta [Candidatus Babeliaceae bacterium]|jgi:phenylalanyl-tRNA synthetase beta chain